MQVEASGDGTTTTARRRSIAAWTVAAASIALMSMSFVIKVAFDAVFSADDTALIVPGLLGGAAFAVIGALIASRTGNVVGWVFLGIAASFAIALPPQNWVDAALNEQRALPFLGVANRLSQWPFFACLGLLPAIFFLYPTGALPSERWRMPWRVYLSALVVTVVGFAVLPFRWREIEGVVVTNPVGVQPLESILGVLLASAGVLLVVSAFVALASLIVRARGAASDERQQIRWLGTVGRVGGLLFLLTFLVGAMSGNRGTGLLLAAANVLLVLLVITVVVGIPAATAVAIFRFRLYDLDLVIKKTVVFAVVVALVVAIGGVVAVLVASGILPSLYDTPPLFMFLGLAYGLAAIPLYRLAKRIADRVVFGGRATPYEVLTEFSERVGETFDADDVLPRMAAVLGEATGADRATVWLQVGAELRPTTTWPVDADEAGVPADAVDVLHRGEKLGALSVSMPPNDPMNSSKERLVRDLASQAGLVLRNVRLIEDLRASRQRLVAAQDEERRKLERNLHDGAQQQLVALAVQLKLARTMIDHEPAKAGSLLESLQGAAGDALEELRDLARGIYPPLLADKGLAAALESEASSADVRLVRSNGHLTFTVHDDGRGFDRDAMSFGTGLQGMIDRLDAVGGDLHVVSAPGAGTTVTGQVPARERPAGEERTP
ncbi:MAG: histidine kinase [Actinomycetota bacterium]